MKSDFHQTDFAETTFGQVAKRRKSKRRGQQIAGVLMLMAGYMSLAVTADTDSGWLLIRVVGGFALLFAGFAVAIGPLISSILGTHDQD
ncbi:MAG: hypothetical protein Q8K87_16540 [Hydrogenophaga sp.]|jgi:hypothetical protein|uniref:hypothetical protein n=1 Tax=Hydrogenophaga sp. TaxID=1904254 RepID=UPI002725E6E6|nr:hypothetical protein [Hydrogenophaga sp.]MDO9200030.1 hypothetical protein [Hydrogenophaga sp.]MDO9567936.1 hypothetical protein [Hydrogenophaga sp.]MDP1895723.1 hypothetical protein [Hydrogenophaga sp.]MDP3376286.1 hypothetical protein [Hydrogenophaga sp.]